MLRAIVPAIVFLLPLRVLAQEDSRAAVPDAAAQKEAEKLIKDLFKDEYARKAAADRQALARKLYQQALDSKDSPASQYVLLRESADLAAETQDVAGCLKSIEELAKSFRIDAWKVKAAALGTATKTARTPEEAAALSGSFLRVADEAASAEDFETAKKSVDAASTLARKAKDMGLVSKSAAKDKEVAELKAKGEKLRKAREVLASKPDDPASCLLVGQYECFIKGNWKEGLVLLANSTDGPLKDLAAKDLSEPADATQQVAVGDGWWDLSEKESNAASRQRLRMRALSWYEKAAPSVAGLNKAKVEKRLKALKFESFHSGTWVEMNDPKIYGKTGKPGDPIGVSRGGIASGRLPPGEYDGLFVRARIKTGSVQVIFEPMKCATWIQTVNPHIMTGRYSPTDQRWEPEGAQIIPVTLQEEYPITVLLVGGEYVVHLHAEVKGRLKATVDALTAFELSTPGGTVVFDQIRLRKKE